MEEFLGVLFCGGRGKRLGEITEYISKSFIPIYDRPVFKYGLGLLQRSKYINEIIILTNDENNQKLNLLGYDTIIQDDNLVFDMFSGWEYIKQVTGTKKHGVLVPSDNISDIDIDDLVSLFLHERVDIVFSLYKIEDQKKLSQMGCYDTKENKFYYKLKNPSTQFGVIAPYVVRHSLIIDSGDDILNHPNSAYSEHKGYWFDIGNYENIIEVPNFVKKIKGEKNDQR